MGRRLLSATWFHVSFAFVAMGGWALWTNLSHGWSSASLAGGLQGLLSALLTLFLKRSVDWLRARLPASLAYWAPPGIAGLCSAGLLASLHRLAGTPELLATLALPLTVSLSYVFIYNFVQTHQSR